MKRLVWILLCLNTALGSLAPVHGAEKKIKVMVIGGQNITTGPDPRPSS